jgi:cell division protein FtsZ
MNHSKPMEESAMSVREKKVRILVLGVGGAGCNAVDRIAMDGLRPATAAENQSGGSVPHLVAINTDSQALSMSLCNEKFQLGIKTTFGLGAGGDPGVGRKAAMEDRDRIAELVKGTDLVFIAAGLGGGTGTGASPFIAQMAKQAGALTLGFVTLPFEFEGDRRRDQAGAGLEELKRVADAVVCVPNDKLFGLAGERASVLDAFRVADDLLADGVRGIWRMLTKPGLINLDFNDLRRALEGRHDGTVFGIGEGQGEDKASSAAHAALNSPLLDGGAIIAEAETILVSLVGGPDLGLAEVQRTVSSIRKKATQNPHIFMGAAIDENFTGKLSLLVIASRGAAAIADAAVTSPLPSERELAASPGVEKSPSEPVVTLPAPAPPVAAGSPPRPVERFLEKTAGRTAPGKRERAKQQTLGLEVNIKGRFDKIEPTVYDGEDLDLPTFLRRGIKIA